MNDDQPIIPPDIDDPQAQDRAKRLGRPTEVPPSEDEGNGDADMGERLERLGGEPAPVITPEEFARLQKAGQVHIDARGRVQTASRSGPDAGVSLRKRRAWYNA